MRLARIHKGLRSDGRPNFEGTMMTRVPTAFRGGRFAAAAGLCVLLAHSGCSTDQVTVPGLSGPSELGLSLRLDASPDVLTADGRSTSAIQATIRGQNGQPLAGRAVTFIVTDSSGTQADIGGLNHPSAVTGPDGTAQVIYKAPVRTDFTANGSVLIQARPIGTDFNGEVFRSVSIELRSAEGRLFPPRSGNAPPTCGIVVEAPFGFVVNQSILFQTRSSDSDGTIVRYFWTFGDDSPSSDKPDVNHVYRVAGSYTVTHIVTDNNGAQTPCTTAANVTN